MFIYFLESNSVFEDLKPTEPKSADPISGADTVRLAETPQREDPGSSQTKGDVTERTDDAIMEVSSVETTEDEPTKAFNSQSQESRAPIPMEVDLSIPSSGASSTEQTPESSQAPITLVSNERKGLETKESAIEDLEKVNSRDTTEEVKGNEEIESAEEKKTSLLNSVSEDKALVSEPETVCAETSGNVDRLAEQETVSYVEKSTKEEIEECAETREIKKISVEENAQEQSKVLADSKDEMTQMEKGVSESKEDVESEKMEIDAISTDNTGNVKTIKTTTVVSPTLSSNPTTSTADTGAVPAQGVASVENKKPPLTVEQQTKKKELMDHCIHALEYCLRRFPQHHKSRYRLAYVYYFSPEHKVTQQFPCVTFHAIDWRMCTIASPEHKVTEQFAYVTFHGID